MNAIIPRLIMRRINGYCFSTMKNMGKDAMTRPTNTSVMYGMTRGLGTFV